MSKPTCVTCPWWRILSPALPEHPGECRKRAPIAHPEAAHYAGFGNDMYAIWPQTNPDDWCGEHPSRKAAS